MVAPPRGGRRARRGKNTSAPARRLSGAPAASFALVAEGVRAELFPDADALPVSRVVSAP